MQGPTGYAFNRSRRSYLATQLSVADTYWSRLRGLMGSDPAVFPPGRGLWIFPSHGVHTFVMRFPIDVAYLDKEKTIIYIAHNLRPWRMAPVSMKTSSVLELPENTLKATGTTIGDEVEITLGKAPQPVHA
ncbi:MAG: DUF192 domain-containing protein [Terriglobales bacterium]